MHSLVLICYPFRSVGPDDHPSAVDRIQNSLKSVNKVLSTTVSYQIFAVFPAISKNKFPQIKITANIFAAKIYSGVNIL